MSKQDKTSRHRGIELPVSTLSFWEYQLLGLEHIQPICPLFNDTVASFKTYKLKWTCIQRDIFWEQKKSDIFSNLEIAQLCTEDNIPIAHYPSLELFSYIVRIQMKGLKNITTRGSQ